VLMETRPGGGALLLTGGGGDVTVEDDWGDTGATEAEGDEPYGGGGEESVRQTR